MRIAMVVWLAFLAFAIGTGASLWVLLTVIWIGLALGCILMVMGVGGPDDDDEGGPR